MVGSQGPTPLPPPAFPLQVALAVPLLVRAAVGTVVVAGLACSAAGQGAGEEADRCSHR